MLWCDLSWLFHLRLVAESGIGMHCAWFTCFLHELVVLWFYIIGYVCAAIMRHLRGSAWCCLLCSPSSIFPGGFVQQLQGDCRKSLDCSAVGGIVECVHFWLVWLAECVSWTRGALISFQCEGSGTWYCFSRSQALFREYFRVDIPDLDVHYFWFKHLGCCCPPGDNLVPP